MIKIYSSQSELKKTWSKDRDFRSATNKTEQDQRMKQWKLTIQQKVLYCIKFLPEISQSLNIITIQPIIRDKQLRRTLVAINVFYIDDEPILCEIFSDFFASQEVIVRTFTDPQLALNSNDAENVDIVFVDFRMPKMSGVKFAEMFDKRFPNKSDYYLVTGEIDPTTDFKFKGVVKKPYEEDVFNEIIVNKLSLSKAA